MTAPLLTAPPTEAPAGPSAEPSGATGLARTSAPQESSTVTLSPAGLARQTSLDLVPADPVQPAWIGLHGAQAYQEVAALAVPDSR